jgi:hypothetical protein
MLEAADRLEMLDLVAKYSYGYDTLDWELMGAVWTDDATLVTRGGERRSRAEIVKGFRARREGLRDQGIQTRHYQTNTLLEETGPGTAGGRTLLFVAWQHDGEPQPTPMHTGEYHDEFRQVDGQWRISRREILIDHD